MPAKAGYILAPGQHYPIARGADCATDPLFIKLFGSKNNATIKNNIFG